MFFILGHFVVEKYLIILIYKLPFSFFAFARYLFKYQMAKLRYPANVTHKAYGICKYAAVLFILLYAVIVLTTRNNSKISQKKASRKVRKRKKMILQLKLMTRLIP